MIVLPKRPLERFADRTSAATLILIVVCDLIPLLTLAVMALVQGMTTGDYPQGAGLAATSDFPPFDPQLWLTWVPVATYGVWAAVTIPLPMRGKRVGALITGFVLFAATVGRIAGFMGSDSVASGGTRYILVVILVIAGLILLRAILGVLHLVPRSWRVARTDSTNAATAGTLTNQAKGR